jgi:periplasmic protein TonB
VSPSAHHLACCRRRAFLISALVHVSLLMAIVLARPAGQAGSGGGSLVDVSLSAFQTQAAAASALSDSAQDPPAPRQSEPDDETTMDVTEQAVEVTQEPPPQPSAVRETPRTEPAPKKETSATKKETAAPKAETAASRTPKPEPKPHHKVHHARARPHHPHARTKTTAKRRREAPKAHKPSPVKQATAAAGADRATAKSTSRSAGGGAERQGAASRYLAELQRAIARHRFYPRDARRRGLEGEVAISFVIQADGRITDVRVARSSGSDSLDHAGVRTLKDLGRFRPIPEELGRSRWMLRVPISYALQ